MRELEAEVSGSGTLTTDRHANNSKLSRADGPLGRLALVYFIASIGIYGGMVTVTLLPFRLLSLFFPFCMRIYGKGYQWGVKGLLMIQPWLRGWDQLPFRFSLNPTTNKNTLIVCNHRSTLDVYVLLASIPCIRLVAKKALLFVPGLNFVMVMTKQTPSMLFTAK